MFDDTKTAAMGMATGANAGAPVSTGGGRKKPVMDQEEAWKSDFRATLAEIEDKGFGAYADKIREQKMEELRKKILASMGLSEEDLKNMPSDQRERIEKMVALEIQKRLAAEDTLDKNGQQGQDTAATTTGIATEIKSAPNGLGSGVLLMQAIEQTRQDGPAADPAAQPAHKDRQDG